MMKKMLLGVALLLTSLASCQAEEERYAGKPLAFWLEELKSDDAFIRDEAIEVLIDAGPAAHAAVPQLEALLEDEQIRVRIRAALALRRIAGQTKPAITTLTEALRDRTAPKRAEMLIQLGQLGPAAASGAPVVVALINDADPVVREQATRTLQRFGAAAVPAILSLFDHADPRVRRDACHTLGLVGLLNPPAKDAVSKLTALLKDADTEVRQEALTALGRLGSFAGAATPAILELTHDKNVSLRAASLKALREVYADAKLARPVALEALKEDNALVRYQAVHLLWRVEPKHPDILPHILELLKQPVGRIELLNLLNAMGPAAARAAPSLAKLLSEPDPNLRRQIIPVLGRMRAAGRAAVPALLELLQGEDYQTRQAVLTALQAIGGDSEQVVPAVVKTAAAKQDEPTRTRCLALLANYGAKAGAAVPWLVEELHRPPSYSTIDIAETLHKIDPERARKEAPPVLRGMLKPTNPWRSRAAMALRRWEPDSKEALHTLIDCINDKNGNNRQEACRLLGTLGKSARDAAPALRGVLRDAAISNRVIAAVALWKITGETETTVPVLLQALKPAPDNRWRYQAARCLSEMGPAIKTAALPTLRKFRDDPDPVIRSHILQAIQQIGEPANKE
jgi:HEAT repeat protein